MTWRDSTTPKLWQPLNWILKSKQQSSKFNAFSVTSMQLEDVRRYLKQQHNPITLCHKLPHVVGCGRLQFSLQAQTCQFTSACSTVAAWWGVQDIDFIQLVFEAKSQFCLIVFPGRDTFQNFRSADPKRRRAPLFAQLSKASPCFAGGKWDLEHPRASSFQQTEWLS